MNKRLPMPEEPKKRKGKGHDRREGGYDDGGHDYEGNEQEFDDPEEHRRIENRRFEGGLPPTPELYERAREQWNQLSGAITKPPTDRSPGEPGEGDDNTPKADAADGKGEKQ